MPRKGGEELGDIPEAEIRYCGVRSKLSAAKRGNERI